MLKFKNRPKRAANGSTGLRGPAAGAVRHQRAGGAAAPAFATPRRYGRDRARAGRQKLHPPARGSKARRVFPRGAVPLRSASYRQLRTHAPILISSSPQLALEGKYRITVKRTEDGFASGYILDHWAAGTPVTVSDAQGLFYYEPLRDAKRVIGLARRQRHHAVSLHGLRHPRRDRGF